MGRARQRPGHANGGYGESLNVCPYDNLNPSKNQVSETWAPLDFVMETSRFFNASVRKSLKVLKSCPRPATASHRLITWAPVLVGVFQTPQVAAQIADLEAANDAKQGRIDELEERFNALAARMEAVENV